MAWCESQQVGYVFGLARNERLISAIADELAAAQAESLARGGPARRFADFTWRTLSPSKITADSWSRKRRVVAKAEHLPKGANPRFVVTSLSVSEIDARTLYEDLYCARGQVENRIKEQQLDLFADRTSAATMRQPAPVVVRILRLCAPRRAPADRPAAHSVRHRHLRHGPAQAPQDRRPGPQERAPD